MGMERTGETTKGDKVHEVNDGTVSQLFFFFIRRTGPRVAGERTEGKQFGLGRQEFSTTQPMIRAKMVMIRDDIGKKKRDRAGCTFR
jgi:hypothetical protein